MSSLGASDVSDLSGSEDTGLKSSSDNIETVRVKEANVLLVSENRSLKAQLARILQLPEEMKGLSEKNIVIANQLRVSEQRVEDLQQRLAIAHQKNQDLVTKNTNLSSLVRTTGEEQRAMSDALKQAQEEKVQRSGTKDVDGDDKHEMRRFFDACSSLLGQKCEKSEQILHLVRDMRDRLNTVKGQECEREDSELSDALNMIAAKLKKAKRRIRELEGQNSTLERALHVQCVKQNANENSELQSKIQSMNDVNRILEEREKELARKVQDLHNLRRDDTEKWDSVLRMRDQRISELQEKLSNPEVDPETVRMIQEIADLKGTSGQAEREMNDMRVKIERLTSKLSLASKAISQVKIERDESKRKLRQMKNVQTTITTENHRLRTEANSLRQSLEAAQKTKQTAVMPEPEVKRPPSNGAIASVTAMEPILEQQRREIEHMSKERTGLVGLITKQASLSLRSERIVAEQADIIASLRHKLAAPKMTRHVDDSPRMNSSAHDLLAFLRAHLIVVLNDPVRSHIDNILLDSSKNPCERLRDIGLFIMSLGEGSSASEPSYPTTISSIVQHGKVKDVVNLVSSLPRFKEISVTRLFQGSAEDRIHELEKLRKYVNASDLSELVSAMIFVNTAIENECAELRSQMELDNSWATEYRAVFGSISIAELETSVVKLRSKDKKIRKLKKKLMASRKVRECCSELEKLCETQVQQINVLKDDLGAAIGDRNAAQSLFEARTEQMRRIEEAHDADQRDSSYERAKYSQEMSDHEKALKARNQDCLDASKKLAEMKSLYETEKRVTKAENESLREQVSLLERKLHDVRNRMNETEQQAKTTLFEKRKENQAEIQHLCRIQNGLKGKLQQVMTAMKEQIAENEELVEQIAKLQTARQEADDQLAQMAVAKTTMEAKVLSLGEQMLRDKEVSATQHRFKSMADEAKYQDEIVALRTKHASQLNTITTALIEEFDELGEFEDVTSAGFQKTLKMIGCNYRQMRERNYV